MAKKNYLFFLQNFLEKEQWCSLRCFQTLYGAKRDEKEENNNRRRCTEQMTKIPGFFIVYDSADEGSFWDPLRCERCRCVAAPIGDSYIFCTVCLNTLGRTGGRICWAPPPPRPVAAGPFLITAAAQRTPPCLLIVGYEVRKNFSSVNACTASTITVSTLAILQWHDLKNIYVSFCCEQRTAIDAMLCWGCRIFSCWRLSNEYSS